MPYISQFQNNKNMKTIKNIKTTLAVLFCLTLFSTGYAQTIDKAKLGLLFDRLAAKKQMTIKRPQGEGVFTKEN